MRCIRSLLCHSYTHRISVIDRWAERKLTRVHLLWRIGDKLTLQQCCTLQQNSINYASIQDLTSWSGQNPLLISSDGLLVTRIDKQFKDLSLYEQGGATYQVVLDEMFTIGNIVVTTLQGFLLPQMALLRSQTRTSVLPRSRSLPLMTGQNICPP